MATESTGTFLDRSRIAGDPVAHEAAQVRVGDARFTVLTTRLIRMEYVPGGHFEDRGTYAFPNRRADVPDFEVRRDDAATADAATVIDTGALLLRYQPDGRPFSAANVTVQLTGGETWAPETWTPGMRDRKNLGGGRRTVDTCRGDAALEPGLVSRSGWALYDDGASSLFEPDGWVSGRTATGALDWYFFGYGHDYAAAVSEYTAFGGRVPLLPRWMLGAWWSRYWPYRDVDLRELVEEFTARDFPLDVLVVDMDWHLPDSWTGYSWNRALFPDPRGFLSWLHARGLHTTLNLHPALGVQPFEDRYAEFAAAMGGGAAGEAVPFSVTDPEFMRHYFELLHHPLEDDGVDFWWMDWQQGRTSQGAGIDPLAWLNHLHFMDLARRPNVRRISFSRWGGLGSHRYPIGFSGDAFSQWSALQFQLRYTAAGANVGYGWWSHDIGGHVGADDPELYVRWVQFGSLSPILRLHSNQDPVSERRPWMFGAPALEAARAAFHARYELIPYLYTAARVAADTGVCPVRPMSWAAPEDDSAYVARFQYLLGDAIIAAPIVSPAEPTTGLASTDVWLPAGNWVERTTGERVTGPRWVRQVADLARVPQFVRAGAMLPLAEVASTTGAQPRDHLILSVFPGDQGSTRVYDDDGTTREFENGEYSWTTADATWPEPNRCIVTVQPSIGEEVRRYTVRLEHTCAPANVSVDGVGHTAWRHDGAATVIEIPGRRRDEGVRIEIVAERALSALDDAHDRQVRAEDLHALLGTSADEAAVHTLPATHPSRAAAIARIGGPLIRIVDYAAPDEAADVLGRVVVAVGPGQRASARATWRLERGGAVETTTTDSIDVAAGAVVLDAPFRWDDSRAPTRWSVDVSATWGDLVVEQHHRSRVLLPSLASWRVSVDEAAQVPSAIAMLRELETQKASWQLVESDPFDIDFAELSDRFVVPLQHDPRVLPDRAYVVHARTRLHVATEGDVAFEYLSSDAIDFYVDGQPLRSDVTGAAPVLFYAQDPIPRRTALMHLSAGGHTLVVRCAKAAETPWPQWCLSVMAVTADREVAFGVSCSAR